MSLPAFSQLPAPIRPALSNLNSLALCNFDLDAGPMPARSVAVGHGASLCSIARFKIGTVAEPSDKGARIGLDKMGSFFSGAEPSEKVHVASPGPEPPRPPPATQISSMFAAAGGA